MQIFVRIIGQLLISIVGGIISGLIVTYILKAELAKILSKDALKRILNKETVILMSMIISVLIYAILVKKGILPVPEFKDYMTVYDKEGNEYLYDGKEKIPTGQKRISPEELAVRLGDIITGEEKEGAGRPSVEIKTK